MSNDNLHPCKFDGVRPHLAMWLGANSDDRPPPPPRPPLGRAPRAQAKARSVHGPEHGVLHAHTVACMGERALRECACARPNRLSVSESVSERPHGYAPARLGIRQTAWVVRGNARGLHTGVPCGLRGHAEGMHARAGGRVGGGAQPTPTQTNHPRAHARQPLLNTTPCVHALARGKSFRAAYTVGAQSH